MRVALLLLLSAAGGFAATWSGTLVDGSCFASRERNVNPTDTLTAVDRDQNEEIRYCAPGAKTKSFTLVQTDGQSFPLDAAGNAKAAELTRSAPKPIHLRVVVDGRMAGKTIQVDSLSISR